MSAPGVNITVRDTPPPRGAQTSTATWFVTGFAERGAASAIEVRSLDEFTRKLGARVTYSQLYDAAETFYREGGTRLIVSRVFGPTPVTATKTLNDSGAVAVLRVDANSPGDWGNTLTVQVAAGGTGGTFVLVIARSAVEVERSPDLADLDAAVAWAAASSYVTVTKLAGTNDPAVAAAAALLGGTDDHAAATDTHWATALTRLTRDLGPGQVSAPGRTTAQAHSELLAHAAAMSRVAILDGPDTTSAVTLKAAAIAARANTNARWGAMFGPWVTIPGVLQGTTRDVPYSPVAAGLMARNDATGGPNSPAAGVNGRSQYALSVKATFTDTERGDLNDAGVNVGRLIDGSVTTYGYRTLVDPLGTAAQWLQLSNVRLLTGIIARAHDIGERYLFAQLDGRRRTIGQFGGELAAMLAGYHTQGALYGDTPDDAYSVDVSDAVNTDATIAAGLLKAVLAVRMSPFAEMVSVEIVKVPITQEVA